MKKEIKKGKMIEMMIQSEKNIIIKIIEKRKKKENILMKN